MKVIDARELATLIFSIIGIVGTVAGLMVDIPAINASPTKKAILIAVLMVATGFLANFIIRRIILRQLNLQRCISDVKKTLVDFTSNNSNTQLNGTINTDEIRLIEKVRRAKSLVFQIKELERLEDRKFQIIIDKGNNDGLEDKMQFKVFHNSQWHELGLCPCTTFDDQAALVITVDQNCPLAMNEIRKDTIQVQLIDAQASNIINLLIANLLYRVDFD